MFFKVFKCFKIRLSLLVKIRLSLLDFLGQIPEIFKTFRNFSDFFFVTFFLKNKGIQKNP